MQDSLTSTLAVAGDGQAGDTEGKYLTFLTAGQLFGVPISDVVQIVGMQRITEIPDYPAYARGVINLRGAIIPVIDVRMRLGRAQAEYSERTCVIVSSIGGRFFGFIVDEVDEVTDLDEDKISPPPKMAGDSANPYLTGIAQSDKKVILLINAAKILGEEELDLLAQGAN